MKNFGWGLGLTGASALACAPAACGGLGPCKGCQTCPGCTGCGDCCPNIKPCGCFDCSTPNLYPTGRISRSESQRTFRRRRADPRFHEYDEEYMSL